MYMYVTSITDTVLPQPSTHIHVHVQCGTIWCTIVWMVIGFFPGAITMYIVSNLSQNSEKIVCFDYHLIHLPVCIAFP